MNGDRKELKPETDNKKLICPACLSENEKYAVKCKCGKKFLKMPKDGGESSIEIIQRLNSRYNEKRQYSCNEIAYEKRANASRERKILETLSEQGKIKKIIEPIKSKGKTRERILYACID